MVALVAVSCGFIMIVVALANVALRRIGRMIGENLTFGTVLDVQWILFSILFLLTGGYAILTNANARVDLVYASLDDRKKSWIEILGYVLFILPFAGAAMYLSWPFVAQSIAVMERSTLPGGIPPWIIKPMIPIAFLLVILQSASELIKHAAFLRGVGPSPHPVHSGPDRSAPAQEG